MKAKKKVAIVGSVGLPANYGGFETMVNHLTLQKNQEIDFTVFCQKTSSDKRLSSYNGSRLKYLPFKANGFQSIIYDIISITLSWFKYDTILILGTPGCLILPFLKIFKNTKTIVNFGGLEWKRDKWIKPIRWYLKLTEKSAIKNATVIVADNQYFCDYIEKNYEKKSILIEYGGDHALMPDKKSDLLSKYPFLKYNYDVSVSRAQPDNNLHIVIEAYIKTPSRNLVLISNFDKFQYGRDLKKKYSNFSNIILQDAVYNTDELNVIRGNADIYVHSHSFCGTAPSLVEAMNLSLPIIAFDVPTNFATTEGKALFFSDSADLTKILESITKLEEEKVAAHMKEIALRRYTWKRISNKYHSVF